MSKDSFGLHSCYRRGQPGQNREVLHFAESVGKLELMPM